MTDLLQKIIIRHLSDLDAARQNFIATKSSKNLKTALQKKTRQTREHFNHGSQVYYKQNGDQKWKGPGKFVGYNGAVIFVRHRGFFIKAHCSHVQLQLAHNLKNSNSNHQIENINNSQDK